MVVRRWLLILLGIMLPLWGVHTQSADDLPTIYDLIQSHPEFTLFAQALEQEGTLIDLLNDPDAELTIFVPTDQTIRSWLQHEGNLPDSMFFERDDLNEMLKYSIVPLAVDYDVLLDYPFSYMMTLLEERGLLIQQVDPSLALYINFSQVDDRYFASNGLIYLVLNDLLIPPAPLFQTDLALPVKALSIAEFIAKADDLTVFHQLLEASPTVQARLAGGQLFTLFVPKDGTIHKYLGAYGLTVAQLLADEQARTDFLQQHIIGGQIRYETIQSAIQLLDGMDFKILNLALAELTFRTTQDGLTVNRVPFGVYNQQLLNGMVHIIDGVIE